MQILNEIIFISEFAIWDCKKSLFCISLEKKVRGITDTVLFYFCFAQIGFIKFYHLRQLPWQTADFIVRMSHNTLLFVFLNLSIRNNCPDFHIYTFDLFTIGSLLGSRELNTCSSPIHKCPFLRIFMTCDMGVSKTVNNLIHFFGSLRANWWIDLTHLFRFSSLDWSMRSMAIYSWGWFACNACAESCSHLRFWSL